MRVFGLLMAIAMCNQVMAGPQQYEIKDAFFLINNNVSAIKFDLQYVANLNKNWNRLSKENQIAGACFLAGRINASASAGTSDAKHLIAYNPTEVKDKNANAHSVRETYFLRVSNLMGEARSLTNKIAEACTGAAEMGNINSDIKTMQTVLLEGLILLDSERKRAIEASGLTKIIGE